MYRRQFSLGWSTTLAIFGVILILGSGAWASSMKVLHSFGDLIDGWEVFARVIVMRGALYGTTVGGGAYDRGMVYRVRYTRSGWKKSTLYTFTGNR
jgi:uncharacterized repeat protein (TIGR03803 family)